MKKALFALALVLWVCACADPDELVEVHIATLSSHHSVVVRLETVLDLPGATRANLQIVSPDMTAGKLNSIAWEEFAEQSGLFTMDSTPNQYRNICAPYELGLAPIFFGFYLSKETQKEVAEIDGFTLKVSLVRVVDGVEVVTPLPTEPLPDWLRKKLPWKMPQQAVIVSELAKFCQ